MRNCGGVQCWSPENRLQSPAAPADGGAEQNKNAEKRAPGGGGRAHTWGRGASRRGAGSRSPLSPERERRAVFLPRGAFPKRPTGAPLGQWAQPSPAARGYDETVRLFRPPLPGPRPGHVALSRRKGPQPEGLARGPRCCPRCPPHVSSPSEQLEFGAGDLQGPLLGLKLFRNLTPRW